MVCDVRSIIGGRTNLEIDLVEEHNRNSPLTAYRVGTYNISATKE